MEAARPWLRAQLRYPLTSRDSDARMASPPHVSATARHPVTVPQLSQLAASINCSGLGMYSAASIMPGQCSHRDMQHAAPIQVLREGPCCCE